MNPSSSLAYAVSVPFFSVFPIRTETWSHLSPLQTFPRFLQLHPLFWFHCSQRCHRVVYVPPHFAFSWGFCLHCNLADVTSVILWSSMLSKMHSHLPSSLGLNPVNYPLLLSFFSLYAQIRQLSIWNKCWMSSLLPTSTCPICVQAVTDSHLLTSLSNFLTGLPPSTLAHPEHSGSIQQLEQSFQNIKRDSISCSKPSNGFSS